MGVALSSITNKHMITITIWVGLIPLPPFLLGLIVATEIVAKANAHKCFGHVLRPEKNNPVRMALKF